MLGNTECKKLASAVVMLEALLHLKKKKKSEKTLTHDKNKVTLDLHHQYHTLTITAVILPAPLHIAGRICPCFVYNVTFCKNTTKSFFLYKKYYNQLFL